MGNAVEFGRMFLSYVFVFGITCVVAGAGIFAGITWRKKKDANASAVVEQDTKAN